MIFRDKQRDFPLQQEILNNGVYRSPEFQTFDLPEEGALLEVVRANAHRVRGENWVSWLIKKHGFTRINNPQVDKEWLRSLSLPTSLILRLLDAGIYPLSKSGRTVLVAASRPDRKDVLEELTGTLNAVRVFPVAITPMEMRELHAIYDEFAPKS